MYQLRRIAEKNQERPKFSCVVLKSFLAHLNLVSQ